MNVLAHVLPRPRAAALLASMLAVAPVGSRAHGEAPQPPKSPGVPDPVATSPETPQPKVRLRVPLFAEEFADVPAAKAGEEIITLRDVRDALGATHMSGRGGEKAGRVDLKAIVDRLLDTRLIVGEARAMGIDELPIVTDTLATFRENTLRAMVEERATEGVHPDGFAVERAYRERTRELKLRTLRFEAYEDASAAANALREGKAFDEVAKPLLEAKKATGGDAGAFFPPEKMLPQVAAALAGKDPGAVELIELPQGFATIVVEDFRHVENPAVRGEIAEGMMIALRKEKLGEYFESLKKKYAVVDEALLARIDYHARSPGFAAFMKDGRPLVRIRGEKPITVAELTKAIRGDFFHGMDSAVREKKINGKKEPKLRSLLSKRLFLKEAAAQKVAQSADYRRRVELFEREVVFGTFVENVVKKDLEVMESEVRGHYDENLSEFTYPAIYRLDALAFSASKDAESALAKLRSGTDMKWLKTNASGQIAPDKRSLQFGDTPLASTGLPERLAKALHEAKAGEYRLFSSDDGQHYVVHVVAVTPRSPRPYPEVRPEIAQKLFRNRLNERVKDWATKLRDAQTVVVYADAIE